MAGASLSFPVSLVRKLVAHARGSTSFRPTYANPEPSPGLFLVADQGIYLMSAGLPRLPDPAKPDTSRVAYARECDPTTSGHWYEDKRALVGGDDFGEWLPLEMFDDLPKSGFVVLRVTDTHIERVRRARKR